MTPVNIEMTLRIT